MGWIWPVSHSLPTPALEQWFTNFRIQQKPLQALFKHILLASSLRVSDLVDLDGL